jgi:hypothetical protein
MYMQYILGLCQHRLSTADHAPLFVAYATQKVKVILRRTVSRPVRPGVRHPSGTREQFVPFSLYFFRQFRVC